MVNVAHLFPFSTTAFLQRLGISRSWPYMRNQCLQNLEKLKIAAEVLVFSNAARSHC